MVFSTRYRNTIRELGNDCENADFSACGLVFGFVHSVKCDFLMEFSSLLTLPLLRYSFASMATALYCLGPPKFNQSRDFLRPSPFLLPRPLPSYWTNKTGRGGGGVEEEGMCEGGRRGVVALSPPPRLPPLSSFQRRRRKDHVIRFIERDFLAPCPGNNGPSVLCTWEREKGGRKKEERTADGKGWERGIERKNNREQREEGKERLPRDLHSSTLLSFGTRKKRTKKSPLA